MARPPADPPAAVEYDPFAGEALLRSVPSTEPQREMWLADSMGREASLAYNESVAVRLRGALDVAAMQRALRGLLERHEALRSTFTADGLTMNVNAAGAMEIPVSDVSGLPPEERAARIATAERDQVERPFDLANGPLFRAEILRIAAAEHIVFLTSHHIVCDGWSAGVLIRDLAAGYVGTALAPAARFSDYAVDQRAVESSPASADDERYWTGRFAGSLPPPLELPADRARPPRRTTASRRIDHEVDAAWVKAVKKLGARNGGSFFVTMLAGFAAVLNRLTGETDVTVGIPAAGQSATGLDTLVGNCVNTLALRTQIDPDADFAALIAAMRSTVLDGMEHQGMTLGTLLRKLPLPRDPARLPLVNVVFNVDLAIAPDSVQFPGLEFDVRAVPRAFETYELFINAVEHPGGLRIECQYNQDLYDEATVRRWLVSLQTLLAAATTAPAGTPLGTLDVLGPEERALLDAFNATTADTRPERLVHEVVAAAAHQTPDRTAVVVGSGGAAVTYRQLEARAAAIARRLRAEGVGPGQLVGLCVERGADMVAALLGILKSGAGYVPLDPAFPRERIAFMVDDARLRVCVTDASSEACLPTGSLRLRLDTITDGGPDSAVPSAPGATPEDVAYVIYTSGSTGRPKGVRVPHRAVVNFLVGMQERPGLTAEDRLVAVTTLSFDIAVLELLLPLTVGATVVLATRDQASDGVALRALLESSRATVLQGTPATWRLLIEAGWQGGARFRALCGGEPMSPGLASDLLARTGAVWNMYGPTETTVWSTCWRVAAPDVGIRIGTAIANTQIWIVDGRGQPCPLGARGELVIGGTGVTLGYLDRPELDAEKFATVAAANGARCYRTGDIARFHSDGQLECFGRTDHQVKIRGYRIELGEIETGLQAHPAVKQAVVLAREDRPGDVRLVAYVVPAAGQSPASEDDLRDHLRRSLPDYMLPAHVMSLAVMPLLPNGKVDRRALPAPRPVASARQEMVAPRDDAEAKVAEVFQELLAIPRISIDDDFFALGGHSLLAAQAAARLARHFGRIIPMRQLFETPTAARLAAAIGRAAAAEQGDAPPAIAVRRDQTQAPLSLMQQRLFFLEELQPGRVVYNVPSAHRLTGPMDEAAFTRTFNEMIRRQPSLRTFIALQDGEPVQQIVPELTVTLFPGEDLSAHEPAARERILTERITADIRQPFTLTESPLFRAKMYRLGPEEHVIFFMLHHIIWDGWSFDLFYEEMSSLSPAFCEGRPAPLPPLPVSYGDFAEWHRGWMQGAALERQISHWKKVLADLPKPLDLPTDLPRPKVASEHGGIEWLRIPREKAEAVRALARTGEATQFMALLAVYVLLLHRLTGQRDLAVGTPVRGRNVPEVEKVMGFFVNALPLRVEIDPSWSFNKLLAEIRARVLDSFSYQDVPFEHLVRELKLPRDESRSPVFQSFFSYQDIRGRTLTWGNLRHSRVPVLQPGTAQDMSLWFVERPEGLWGGLNYATDLFTVETARLFNARYARLVDAVLEDPSRSVGELALMSDTETDELRRWNQTAAATPHQKRVDALFSAQAARVPDRPALIMHGPDGEATTLSYAALDARANQLARCLRRRGVVRGTLVGIGLERSFDMVATMLAVMKAGGTYVPLDPTFPRDRLAFMVDDAGLGAIVAPRDVAGQLGLADARVLSPDDDAQEIASESAEPPPPLADRPDAEDAAYVIYTSGSTGRPKGVRVPHRGVTNFLASMQTRPGIGEDDRLLAVTTLSFDIAVLELLLPLVTGATVIVASHDDAIDGVALRSLLESSRATMMQATPATWRLLLEAGWQGPPGFRALIGGERLPPALAASLLERCTSLFNMYGPTETTVWSTVWEVREPSRGIWIGTPIANTQVRVLDDRLAPCPIGVPGEIFIGGDGVALGYLNRPELTAERFIADPFRDAPGALLYRTGDVGRWRHDGQLEYIGRSDFQVKVRGHRIELGEIETVLAGHAHVAEAVVTVRPGPGGESQLVAHFVARGSEPPTSSDLRKHLRGKLPDYMVPPAYIAVDRFPLTPSGKVDRKALVSIGAAPAAASDGHESFVAPQTPTERAVAAVWQELLGVGEISIHDNFFDIGGHSLLVMRAIAEMARRTGRRISPRHFIFETLHQVASAYDGAASSPSPEGPKSGPSMKNLLSDLLKS